MPVWHLVQLPNKFWERLPSCVGRRCRRTLIVGDRTQARNLPFWKRCTDRCGTGPYCMMRFRPARLTKTMKPTWTVHFSPKSCFGNDNAQEDESPPNKQCSILSDRHLGEPSQSTKGPICVSYTVLHDPVGRSSESSRMTETTISKSLSLQNIKKNCLSIW